jgi:type IV pilus assembly protein PilC
MSMLLGVIPRFAELFQDIPGQLPLLTRCIFYFSTLLREQIGWLLILLSGCILIIFHYRHSSFHFIKNIATKLPLIQAYLHKITLVRFTRYLALTMSAGIPVTQALLLTIHASGNRSFVNLTLPLHRKINAGISLHQALATLTYFPTLMIQMVKIGEESGMLEAMLTKFAELIETDIDQLLQRLNLLLEPLIMMVLGVLIGGLVIGMYLPIFKLGNAI